MTAQIQYPGEYTIDGVFSLDANDLRELDGLLDEGKKAFDKRARQRLNREVNKQLKNREVKEEHKDDVKKVIRNHLKNSSSFSTDEPSVSVDCQSKNKITGKSFTEIINRDDLEHEYPTEAAAIIRRGDYRLRVRMFSLFNRGQISVLVSPSDDLAINVARGIRDWAEAKRQVPWWPKFNFFFGFFGYLCLSFSFLWIPYGVFSGITVTSPVYECAKELLADEIGSENQAEAIELLLRFRIENVAPTTHYRLDVKPWYVFLLLSGVVLITAAVLCPKSRLGLGRSTRRMKFDRWVIRHVKVSLWIWLGAITCSIIGSAVYEWVIRARASVIRARASHP